MAAAIEGRRPGDEVQIEYYRGDERKTVSRDADQAPGEAEQPELAAETKPAVPHALASA